MKKIEKFIRSRNGMLSLFGALVILLLIVAYASGALGRITGTAGVSFPMPPTGVTCLPTCAENDGRMFMLTGTNQQSLVNIPVKVWIMVPGDQTAFTLGIFDGDSGKDTKNVLNFSGAKISGRNGNWDDAQTGDTTYTLYADPLADGSGSALASWKGNDVMPNNAWWETTINNDAKALAANGHYYYRLEATRPADPSGANAFKVRATGYLMTGLRQDWPVALVGMLATNGDITIMNNAGLYKGDWNLSFKVATETQKIEIWDADFDFSSDTDDPNTAGKPAWATASTLAVAEGALVGPNGKADDSATPTYTISPAVVYDLVDPDGNVVCANGNPSNAKEWEDLIVSANSGDNPDCLTGAPLKAGMYTIRITGLDTHNFIWLGINYPICDSGAGCPPMPNE